MDKEFKKDIELELKNLERLIREMKEIIKKVKNEPDFITIRAAGSIIHDFYCGVEKIFERIALNIDDSMPKGEDWHTKLLLQMTQVVGKRKRPVIDSEFMQNLKEFLRFRHLFRNIYGFELKWKRIKPLCVKSNDVYNEFKAKIEKFLEC